MSEHKVKMGGLYNAFSDFHATKKHLLRSEMLLFPEHAYIFRTTLFVGGHLDKPASYIQTRRFAKLL
jgi:hypothetical protein